MKTDKLIECLLRWSGGPEHPNVFVWQGGEDCELFDIELVRQQDGKIVIMPRGEPLGPREADDDGNIIGSAYV